MRRYALAAMLVTISATAAMADYYVVQDNNSKECKVVETVPQDQVWVQVGPVAFSTRDEAEKEVTVLCKEHHKDHPKVKIIEKH